jgi:hypothetical protein
MRMGRVWAVAAVLIPLVVVLRGTIEPHDVFWQLAYGRAIWESKSIPSVDTFSFTRAGEPFFDQPWLAQLLMFGVHGLGDLKALVAMQLVVVASAMALLVSACFARTNDEGAAGRAVLLVALPVSMNNLGIRPQSIALVPCAVFVCVLSRWRARGSAPWWLLFPAMVVWVNVHGSFVLGVGLVLLHAIGAMLRRAPPRAIALALGVTISATLVNPRGLRVYGYVFGLLQHGALGRVEEWSGASPLAIAFVIASAILIGIAKKRPAIDDLFTLGTFAIFGLLAPRNAIWAGFVGAPILSAPLADKLAFDASARSVPGAIACAAGAIAITGFAMFGRPKLADTPVEAVRALRAMPHRPERLLSTEGTGSYLMWAAPEQKTFVDTRIELFPPSQWDEWASMMRGENVDALVAKWAIDGMLIEARHDRLRAWAEDHGWQRAFDDGAFSLFVR